MVWNPDSNADVFDALSESRRFWHIIETMFFLLVSNNRQRT